MVNTTRKVKPMAEAEKILKEIRTILNRDKLQKPLEMLDEINDLVPGKRAWFMEPEGERQENALKMVEACAKGLRSILPAADSEALDTHIADLRAALREQGIRDRGWN